MTYTSRFIGIDISKSSFDICFALADQRIAGVSVARPMQGPMPH
jgi:hypothetical protein